MSYEYQSIRPQLFTEDGVAMLLKVGGNVRRHIKAAGAVRAFEAWEGVTGDSFTMTACLDYMLERREIREVTSEGTWGQYRVFCAPLE